MLGLVLFVVGVVVLVEGKNWNEIVDNKTVPVSVMLIIVGLIIAVVGFLGCCGAMKQNGAMLLVVSISDYLLNSCLNFRLTPSLLFNIAVVVNTLTL